MLRIAIVDNNINDINCIILIVREKLNQELNLEIFQLSTDLKITQDFFDVYLLDIDMPVMNGIELAEKIRQINPDGYIVFITNHDNLVFNSFKVNPFYFVRKSVLKNDLILALNLLLEDINKKHKTVLITVNNEILSLLINEIVYIEKMKNYIVIKCNKNREYKHRKSISKFEEEVNDTRLIRIHNSILVNLQYVNKIENNELYIDYNNLKLPISRLKNKYVKSKYIDYLRNKY